MDEVELLRRLAVALAIGLLIGLERGWQTRDENDHQRPAGLRTFALTGLLGGVCGVLSAVSAPIVLATGLVVFTLALLAFTLLEAQANRNFSATSVVAGILTFVLGAYAALGIETVAVSGAVAMAILLALREPLHSWVRTITWPEMRSVLVLLAMSFLLLPVLPNRAVDPWNALNPAEIWLLAILIATVSFAGYIAVRAFGDRMGIAIAAVAGGLASSTATSLSFARIAREHPEHATLLAGGSLLSGTTMFVRIVVFAGALQPSLFFPLLWPSLAAAVVMIIATVILMRQRDGAVGEYLKLSLDNPFDLGTVLKLAALIAVTLLLAKIAAATVGQRGIYLLAAMSGVADVDALTLSMARVVGAQVTAADATAAILIAAAVNTVSKTGIAAVVGGRWMGTLVGAASAAALVAMLVTFLLV